LAWITATHWAEAKSLFFSVVRSDKTAVGVAASLHALKKTVFCSPAVPMGLIQRFLKSSWHGVCFIKVGLWLQPGRIIFEILGGMLGDSDRAALFYKWAFPYDYSPADS
jgi:hypothetical protein